MILIVVLFFGNGDCDSRLIGTTTNSSRCSCKGQRWTSRSSTRCFAIRERLGPTKVSESVKFCITASKVFGIVHGGVAAGVAARLNRQPGLPKLKQHIQVDPCKSHNIRLRGCRPRGRKSEDRKHCSWFDLLNGGVWH